MIDAKDYLRKVKKYNAKIDRMRDTIERLYAMATKCTISLEGFGSSSGINDKMAEIVARCMDKSKEYVATIEEYQKLQMEVIDEILAIDEQTYADLLYKYYVEDKPMKVVSRELQCDDKYIYVLHRKALYAFSNEILKNKLNHE